MNILDQKSKLEIELGVLTTELKVLGVQDPHNPSDWVTAQALSPEPDLNDVADHTEEYNEDRATLSVLETQFNAVKEALKKIDDGTYGICTECKAEIAEDRLLANPSAITCIAHAD